MYDLQEWWRTPGAPPLVLEGPPAWGKTTLLQMFARWVLESSHDPVSLVHLSQVDSIDVVADASPKLMPGNKGLLALDEAERLPLPTVVALVGQLQRQNPAVAILLAARSNPERSWPKHWHHVRAVGSLPASPAPVSIHEWARSQGPEISDDDIKRLFPLERGRFTDASHGSLLDTVLQYLPEARFDSFFADDISRSQDGLRESELDIRVCAVNDDLIRHLSEDPALMYSLRPRQLEELMAELYLRQGFEVELTQETRDEGVDLYVVQHTAMGRTLTLVDTKRNREDRKVGVGIVRQMYGVVEAKRANAGVIATTSFFTRDAHRFQERIPFRLRLQDYDHLTAMLRDAARRPS